MGLSSKLILASKKAGTLINWQGRVSLALTYAGLDAYVYSYTRAYQDEGEGSLSPLLQTIKSDTQIYNVTLAVDPTNMLLIEAALYFYNLPEPVPPASKRFTGLTQEGQAPEDCRNTIAGVVEIGPFVEMPFKTAGEEAQVVFPGVGSVFLRDENILLVDD